MIFHLLKMSLLSILPAEVNQQLLEHLIQSDRAWAAKTLPAINKSVGENYYASITDVACQIASYTDRLDALRIIRKTEKLVKLHLKFVREGGDQRDVPYEFVIKKPVDTFLITTGYRITRYPSRLKTLIINATMDDPRDGPQIAPIPKTVEFASVHLRMHDDARNDWGWNWEDTYAVNSILKRCKDLRVLDVYVDFMGDFTDVACELKQLEVLKIDTTDGVLISKTGDYVDLTRCTNLKIFGLFTDEEEVSFRTMRLPPSLEVMHVGEYPFEFPNGVPQLKALTMMWHVETPISQDTWCSMWEHVEIAGVHVGFNENGNGADIHILPPGKDLRLYVFVSYFYEIQNVDHMRPLRAFKNRATEIVVIMEHNEKFSSEYVNIVRECCPNASLVCCTAGSGFSCFSSSMWNVVTKGRMPEMPDEMKHRLVSKDAEYEMIFTELM